MHHSGIFSRLATRIVALGAAVVATLAIGSAQGCPVTVTHSGANFQGGQFVIQAGFAENEAAAASFTLPATAFPVKMNLAEMIFATFSATQQTVTHWQFFAYSGPPTSGNLIASYDSDDVILPHLRIGPGTAGVNLQFSIDPGDPDQLIIPDDGSHMITVGYRILQHNNAPANPCDTPDRFTNAFPTTDANGLGSSAENWLDSINCGPLGAPAGWHSFAQLNSLFRPTGDWNIRLTYESLNPLQITTQPQDNNIPLGQPAIFQIEATGPGSLSYQWYKGTTQVTNSGRIFGATTNSLVIFPTIASDAGVYRCIVTSPCGSATSNDAHLNFNGPPVTGNVVLNDWAVSRLNQVVQIEVHSAGSGTSLQTQNVILDASGNYTFNLAGTIAAGNYDFYARGLHWLRKLRGNVAVSSSGATGVNFTLTNGDIDSDNEVGPGDFGGLSSAYGSSTGDPNFTTGADLDGDGEVGPSDFGILSGNYGLTGD